MTMKHFKNKKNIRIALLRKVFLKILAWADDSRIALRINSLSNIFYTFFVINKVNRMWLLFKVLSLGSGL